MDQSSDPGRELRLVGIAEIAELAGLSRQAVANQRQRDSRFPAPVAELRSGPVFLEDQIRAYLLERGRDVPPPPVVVPHTPGRRFNPLDRLSLARSVQRELLARPAYHLADLSAPFEGEGVYALYYDGDHPAYTAVSGTEVPLYVSSVPSSRLLLGNLKQHGPTYPLHRRLFRHAQALRQVEEPGGPGEPGLRLEDFTCRLLVVEEPWAKDAEELMIADFRPLWNTVIEGFATYDPGHARRTAPRYLWDELHPGRPWAATMSPARLDRDAILALIHDHVSEAPTADT